MSFTAAALDCGLGAGAGGMGKPVAEEIGRVRGCSLFVDEDEWKTDFKAEVSFEERCCDCWG